MPNNSRRNYLSAVASKHMATHPAFDGRGVGYNLMAALSFRPGADINADWMHAWVNSVKASMRRYMQTAAAHNVRAIFKHTEFRRSNVKVNSNGDGSAQLRMAPALKWVENGAGKDALNSARSTTLTPINVCTII